MKHIAGGELFGHAGPLAEECFEDPQADGAPLDLGELEGYPNRNSLLYEASNFTAHRYTNLKSLSLWTAGVSLKVPAHPSGTGATRSSRRAGMCTITPAHVLKLTQRTKCKCTPGPVNHARSTSTAPMLPQDVYDIAGAETVIRGTIRYAGFSIAMRAFQELGMFNLEPNAALAPGAAPVSWPRLLLQLLGAPDDTAESDVEWQAGLWATKHYGVENATHIVSEMSRLTLFDGAAPAAAQSGTIIDSLCRLLEERLAYVKVHAGPPARICSGTLAGASGRHGWRRMGWRGGCILLMLTFACAILAR